MTTILQKAVDLSKIFNAERVRKVTIDEDLYASIYDVLQAVAGTGGSARQTWSRYKSTCPDIVARVRMFQFEGAGQRPTPVAKESEMLSIIFNLPGSRAREMCATVVQTFLQALNPSEDYVSGLVNRIDLIQNERGSEETVPSIFKPVLENTYTLADRCHNETSLYIRMRLPLEFGVDTDNPKRLTTDILKFGIAYSVHVRNGQYTREKDNGYMAFSVTCASRKEASVIEDILRYEFSAITVLNSFEYVDAGALAEMLNVPYVENDYASYAGVAVALFGYTVTRLHDVWKQYSDVYGFQHDLITTNSTIVHSCETGLARLHTELTFRSQIIDKARALELGMIQPDPPAPQPQQVHPTEPEPSAPRPLHPNTIRMLEAEKRGDLTIDDMEDAESSPVNDVAAMKEKFDRFVVEVCTIDPEGSVSSVEIRGRYRLWAREDGREIFSAISKYLSERFRPGRIDGRDKNTTVNGFKGVRIEPSPAYELPDHATLREQFVYETCDRGAAYKVIQSQMVKRFREWVQETRGKAATDAQVRSLKEYMKENFFKSNIWKQADDGKHAGGTGYWGVGFKEDSNVHRAVSTTSKTVKKVSVETGETVKPSPWPSIAKASEEEDWCAAKMSRAIKNETIHDGYRYVHE